MAGVRFHGLSNAQESHLLAAGWEVATVAERRGTPRPRRPSASAARLDRRGAPNSRRKSIGCSAPLPDTGAQTEHAGDLGNGGHGVFLLFWNRTDIRKDRDEMSELDDAYEQIRGAEEHLDSLRPEIE